VVFTSFDLLRVSERLGGLSDCIVHHAGIRYTRSLYHLCFQEEPKLITSIPRVVRLFMHRLDSTMNIGAAVKHVGVGSTMISRRRSSLKDERNRMSREKDHQRLRLKLSAGAREQLFPQ